MTREALKSTLKWYLLVNEKIRYLAEQPWRVIDLEQMGEIRRRYFAGKEVLAISLSVLILLGERYQTYSKT